MRPAKTQTRLHIVKQTCTSKKELNCLMRNRTSPKAAFPRAKFLCHISHALQSLLTDFCGIIAVNLYSRTATDEKWINNKLQFGHKRLQGMQSLAKKIWLCTWSLSIVGLLIHQMSCFTTKQKNDMCPVKTPSNLDISPVWTESSLCTQ